LAQSPNHNDHYDYDNNAYCAVYNGGGGAIGFVGYNVSR
jgi:hypothetical protein